MPFNVVAFWPAHRQALTGWPDLSIFYTAGAMIRRGPAQLLYSVGAQSRIQRELPEPFAGRGVLPYNHPPFEALPYAAMTGWRALKGVLGTASIEVVISWMIAGTKTLAQYPVYVLQVNRRRSPGVIIVPDNMPNLRGLFMAWGKESLAH